MPVAPCFLSELAFAISPSPPQSSANFRSVAVTPRSRPAAKTDACVQPVTVNGGRKIEDGKFACPACHRRCAYRCAAAEPCTNVERSSTYAIWHIRTGQRCLALPQKEYQGSASLTWP